MNIPTALMVKEKDFSLSVKVIACSALILFAAQSTQYFTSPDEQLFEISDRKF